MKNNNDAHALDRLCDFLVEDILSATDDEILQEAVEDYPNPDIIVASVQESIGKARLAVAKKKLSETKETKTCIGPPRVILIDKFDNAEVTRIFKILAQQNDELQLSIAARKGSELTAEDMRTLLEDLQDLGCDLSVFITNSDNE